MKILIFNNQMRRRELYQRNECDDMPYMDRRSLQVKDFRGSSTSSMLWSTAEFLQSVNHLNRTQGFKVPWIQGFRRAFEIATDEMMIHSRGTAADLGHDRFCPEDWRNLSVGAETINCFHYVSDLDTHSNLVHVHHVPRMVSPLIPFAHLQPRDISVDVCVMQDALWSLGYSIAEIDGCFGKGTLGILKQFQNDMKIPMSGHCDRLTWEMLMRTLTGNPFYGEPDYPEKVN